MDEAVKAQSPAPFLPMTTDEMDALGWEQCDFVLVTGDAYVDHPSFGAAVIGRSLEADGFRVGIIAQPDWKQASSLQVLGRPRLAFLITAGNMDSMVNHYTAARRLRHNDSYSPGGVHGRRPDRALIVYANLARAAYKGVPVILGGIEASLRRLSHYDYWSDKLRRSVLLDAKADILLYGMAERSMRAAARLLAEGHPVSALRTLRGAVYRLTRREMEEESADGSLSCGSRSLFCGSRSLFCGSRSLSCAGLSPMHDRPAGSNEAPDSIKLPSFEEAAADKQTYARSFAIRMENADPYSAKTLIEPSGDQYIIRNPPDFPLSQTELDAVYELPYARRAHPAYTEPVPALEEVRFSLVSSRGCFGGCTFCALTFHQGRIVQGRSHESLLREAAQLTAAPGFKGYIHDVGGPTANFRGPACDWQKSRGACPSRQCLFPEPCPQLRADHRDYIELLRKLRSLPHIKKVFIRSGIRFDYLLLDKENGPAFLQELCRHHISGQLKVAPEHVSDRVLAAMGKTKHAVYTQFMREYAEMNRRLNKKQYLVPYFIAAHPGAGLEDAVALAEFCREQHFIPKQVQEFYPTPGTVATCMYYTGIDPRTMEPVYVAKGDRERRMHKVLLQFDRPENRKLVREALQRTGRTDLLKGWPGKKSRSR